MSRTPTQPVPPLQCKTVFEKGSEQQRFGEHISHLILCGNWMHRDVLANVGPEEVESLVDVFGFEVDSWDLLQSPRRHYCLGRLCNGLVQ